MNSKKFHFTILFVFLLIFAAGLPLVSKANAANRLADFNGDTYADLAIGVPFEAISGPEQGAVNILYGSSPAGLSAAGNDAWGQFSDPAEDEDKFAFALAAGNFDGDAYIDLAVGVPGEDINDVEDAGAVNIMYGAAAGISDARVEFWHQDTGTVGSLAETGDQFGYALAVGDFNDDGYDDLAVGLPYEDWIETDAGIVQILYGSATGLTDTGNELWRQGAGGIDETEEPYDRFGYALTAGDFNGDGYADLAIGAPEEDYEDIPVSGAGAVHILHGSSAGLTADDWQMWAQAEMDATDRFGHNLSSGNYNGDRYDDLAVGVPYEDVGDPEVRDAGAVDILFGSTDGLSGAGHQIFDRGGNAEQDAYYGFALSSGDYNGDGKDDLAVGIPWEDLPAGMTDVVDAGAVEILYGASAGLIRRMSNDFWHQDRSGMGGGFEASDHFGRALASGDFNGDTYTDLAVGVPFEDIHDVGDNEGAVHILYGSSDGISAAGNWFFHQDTTDIDGIAEPDDRFGLSLAACQPSVPEDEVKIFLPMALKELNTAR